MSDLTVDLSDLQTALHRVLEAMRSEYGDTVAIPVDYYWHLPTEASAFDPLETPEPDALVLGQVSDDLEELGELVARPVEDDTLATWHDLMHLTGVLRALEHVANP